MQCAAEYTRKLASVVTTSFAQRFADLAGMAEVAISELTGIAETCHSAAEGAMRRLAAELLPIDWLRVDFETCSFEIMTVTAQRFEDAEPYASAARTMLQLLATVLERLATRGQAVLRWAPTDLPSG